jgi:hypothetical protein
MSESYLVDKSFRNRGPDAMNRRQRNFKPTVVRYVNSRYQRHFVFLTLPLLMFRVGAHNPNYVATANHLATGADGLY